MQRGTRNSVIEEEKAHAPQGEITRADDMDALLMAARKEAAKLQDVELFFAASRAQEIIESNNEAQNETGDIATAINDMEDRYTRIKSKLTEVTRTSKRRLGAAKSMGKKHEEALERMERELQGAVREQRDMEDQLMQVRLAI